MFHIHKYEFIDPLRQHLKATAKSLKALNKEDADKLNVLSDLSVSLIPGQKMCHDCWSKLKALHSIRAIRRGHYNGLPTFRGNDTKHQPKRTWPLAPYHISLWLDGSPVDISFPDCTSLLTVPCVYPHVHSL